MFSAYVKSSNYLSQKNNSLIKNVIYLDNNSTTAVDSVVIEKMLPYFTDLFANANSTHLFGVEAYEAVKLARKQVANIIGAEQHEIVFTSGATESINIAIKGVAENYQTKGKHIITVSTEHSAVLDTCNFLESKGFEITYLTVNSEGLVDLNDLKNKLRSDTILVTLMLANNETGVVNPVKEIAELTHTAGALFMSDVTQAIGKIDVNVDELGIDILCLSGHKIYAPKGIGGLFVRQRNNRVKLPALIHGVGHERGMRSGTLNVPGIVALGAACEVAKRELIDYSERISELRNFLESELLKIPGTKINGSTKSRLPNTSNVQFNGVDSDAIILALSNPENDVPMIAVSNGSACTSSSVEPSHVLTAMGLDETDAFSSIRFSLGKFNTHHEIKIVISTVTNAVNRLRLMLG